VIRRTNDKWLELDDIDVSPANTFLPDEQTETAQVAIADLRTRVNKLEQQVHALYTAMASYATIAERNTDTARAEARADLDRTQSTVIGLIEKLRRDLGGSTPHGYGGVGGTAINSEHVLRIDERIDRLTTAVEHLAREQAELHQHVARLVEKQMSDEGWLASDGPAESLSLR
jgi:outer membrane murein-binding lipoprotein Lpp